MQLIDSHIHFWNPTRLRYPWLDTTPQINKPYLPADLPSSGEGWEMVGLVFVEANPIPEQNFQEVSWVNTLADDDQRIKGIVAYAALESNNFHAGLDVLQAHPLVKGVRRNIQGEANGFATRKHFVKAVGVLPQYGFSFDLCVKYHQLAEAVQLVKACPDVAFVLDHIGKPNIAEGEIDLWRAHISQLAELENVHCKVSGMVTEADLDHWQPEQLRPYVDHVLEVFTPARLMFGGDYPVLEMAHITYNDWVKVALELLKDLSPNEQHLVFYENAQKFYRL
ncbi:MAG: amidohydrolase family protein [Phototrophicaceae bacterium]|jgi:L-fuconolactonase